MGRPGHGLYTTITAITPITPITGTIIYYFVLLLPTYCCYYDIWCASPKRSGSSMYLLAFAFGLNSPEKTGCASISLVLSVFGFDWL